MTAPSPAPAAAVQSFLFEVDQTRQADGSIVVRPRRMVDGNYISAQRAAGLLGFRDRETIYGMVRGGVIKGWKPDSKRGNGKWRIDLGSVLDYKTARERAAVRDMDY